MLPAKYHHNPNQLPTIFHIGKVKSFYWKLYMKLCMTRLIAIVKWAELSLRSFFSVMVVNFSLLRLAGAPFAFHVMK